MDKILRLNRVYRAENYTIGHLYDGSEYICDTLEDKVRDYNKDGDLLDAGETKIFGETAIPYGRYRVIVVQSPKFKRRLPYLMNVPHFTGILMHRGVTQLHTHGCILVGKNKQKGRLSDGPYWELKVKELIEKYIDLEYNVYIEIV